MIKSTLIYDGECGFCIRWVSRLKFITKDNLDYLASQQIFDRFPQISAKDYERSIQWVDIEGNVFQGIEAVFRALACAPGKTWPLWIYRNIPGLSWVAEKGYQIVSRNRKFFGAIS